MARKKPVTLDHLLDGIVSWVYDLACVLAWIAILIGIALLIGG